MVDERQAEHEIRDLDSAKEDHRPVFQFRKLETGIDLACEDLANEAQPWAEALAIRGVGLAFAGSNEAATASGTSSSSVTSCIPGRLYAQLPGASRSAYLASAGRLLTIVDARTRIYAAHMARTPAPAREPVLEVADLKALERLLIALDAGHPEWTGFYPQIYPVRGRVSFATGFPWNHR